MTKNNQGSTISIDFDAEKTRALRQFMDKKDLQIETELTDFLNKLYEKHVPPQVREFIEMSEDLGQKANPKILQDKGVMPQRRHNTKETPIGNANRENTNDIKNESMT